MTFQTLLCGIALVAIGVMGYVSSTEEKQSPTALIPAAFGAILVLCAGIVAMKPTLRKHVMHAAAMIGVLGFLGGFMPIIRTISKDGEVSLDKPSIRNGVMMSVVCLAFVLLCMKSFIDARKARLAK